VRDTATATCGAITVRAELSEPAGVDEDMSFTPAIGRNEPCPCGSGKKYKRSCMDSDMEVHLAAPVPGRSALHDLDGELVQNCFAFAGTELKQHFSRHRLEELPAQLAYPLAAFHAPFRERPLAQVFLDARPHELTARHR